MARVVVVTSSELEERSLAELVGPDDELVVVVAAVDQSPLEWLASDEDSARAEAGRVGATVERRAPARHSVTHVRADSPGQLVQDAIAEHRPDRVVVAFRDGDDASWLEADAAEVHATVAGVPVTRVRILGS